MLDKKVFFKEKCFNTLDYLLKLIIKNMAIWKKIIKKSVKFGAIFSMKNPLYSLQSYFSG
jgi:hypothetical protein